MNILNDKQDQNHVAVNQIEHVEQEKMEYKLIDTFLRTPGLKLWFYNPETEVIAEVIEKEVQKGTAQMVITSEKDYVIEDMAKLWEMQWALQRKILEEFESLGLVFTKKIGLKNYYRIDIPTFEIFMQTCIKEYNEELNNKYKKQGLED